MNAKQEQNRGQDSKIFDSTGTAIEGKVNSTAKGVRLDVEIPNLPEAIDALGEHWIRKGEFHVTLIGSGLKLEDRLRERNPDLSHKKAGRLINLVLGETLAGKSFKVIPQDELRIAQEKDRKTIVRMCSVEGTKDFFSELSRSLGLEIEAPPTHITLYTLRNGWPIGIYNRQRLDEVTRKLTRPESHEIGKHIGLVNAISGHNYAWGKTARNISEDTIKQTIEETDGDFSLVDLCSAFPLFTQILRERHKKERCYTQAKKITGELSNILTNPPGKMPDELKGEFNTASEMTDKNRQLRNAMTPKNALLRKVLTSLIEDFLYDPPSVNQDDPGKQVASTLLGLLQTYNTFYEDVFELEEKVGRGRWQIRTARNADVTPYSQFKEILGEEADKFMTGLSAFLAKKILPHLRKFRAISLDIATPQELRDESKESFPDEFNNTEFYRRIGELKDHMPADMSHLPFQPESVSFFTCFEGWPFDRLGFSETQVRDMAVWVLISLKPGGRALFFPWQVQDETPQDRKQLESVESLWKSLGAKITRKEFTRDELKGQMADRELVLVDHSPVFQEPNNVFTALIVEKPKLAQA